MATQEAINQAKQVSDTLWNVYQTIEDMELKMKDCDDVADFKERISLDSFDAIGQVIREAMSQSNHMPFTPHEKFSFEDLDGRNQQGFVEYITQDIKHVSDTWKDRVMYSLSKMMNGTVLLKDFEKVVNGFKRDELFKVFGLMDTVSRSKPDEEDGGEKSIKRILDTESAGLSPKSQNIVKKLIFDLPDLIKEYQTLGDELHSSQYDQDLMRMFLKVANEIVERTYEVDKVFVEEGLKADSPTSLLDAHDRVNMMIDEVEFILGKPNRYWDNGDTDKHFQKSVQSLKQVTKDLQAALDAVSNTDPALI